MAATKHIFFWLLLVSTGLQAAVLPEDRADIFYHRYDGGGSTIDGPSVLVRKEFADKVSVWGNYYVDMLSSASIDVMTSGSPYSEERIETSAGLDYLNDRTIVSLNFTNSSENDYEANTFGFGISQDFFGDLTTLSMNYSQGNDTVKQNVRDPDSREIVGATEMGEARHQRFSLGLSQILTKTWIVSANVESVIDDGFLNNPYRSARFLGATDLPEQYPNTRNSDALSLRSINYLPYRASLKLEYRLFADSWGISANNYEIAYSHPYRKQWIFEGKVRTYSQSSADFFYDLIDPAEGTPTFFARDKEMSEFSNLVVGVGASYQVLNHLPSWIDKMTINFYVDHMNFDYAEFRDATSSAEPGQEPLYGFSANVFRLFVSAWY